MYYRVLEGSKATERDFISKAALGETLLQVVTARNLSHPRASIQHGVPPPVGMVRCRRSAYDGHTSVHGRAAQMPVGQRRFHRQHEPLH